MTPPWPTSKLTTSSTDRIAQLMPGVRRAPIGKTAAYGRSGKPGAAQQAGGGLTAWSACDVLTESRFR